jgi:hypothetical protein
VKKDGTTITKMSMALGPNLRAAIPPISCKGEEIELGAEKQRKENREQRTENREQI